MSITRAALAPSTFRTSACAQTAPNIPVLAPTTATGLPQSAFSPFGREAQSSAFLSWPGIEELYSGVAIRTASADSIAARSRRAPAGAGPLVVVLVVGLDGLQPIEDHELHGRRQQLRRRPQKRRVVRVATQAS